MTGVATLLARCTFPAAGTAVELAVSGGPDSMALLVLATAARLRVTAVHVDHGLRPTSGDDAAIVAAAAERFGARFVARSVDVGAGPNLEDRARVARYAVLSPTALTGHTLDDQAETVLMFLLRGTGPAGLAGIDPQRRPLLALRRSETAGLCRSLDIATVDDEMNRDPRFTRTRVRHELIPLMDEIAGRDVAPLIAAAAGLQRDLLRVVDTTAAELDPTDAVAVAGAPAAVAAAALRRWWRAETGSAHAPDRTACERMLAVARGDMPRTDVTGGWSLARTAQRLRLVPPPTGRG